MKLKCRSGCTSSGSAECETHCALQVSGDGAILVRPDGHIAWRAHSLEGAAVDSTARAADSLRTALKALHYL